MEFDPNYNMKEMVSFRRPVIFSHWQYMPQARSFVYTCPHQLSWVKPSDFSYRSAFAVPGKSLPSGTPSLPPSQLPGGADGSFSVTVTPCMAPDNPGWRWERFRWQLYMQVRLRNSGSSACGAPRAHSHSLHGESLTQDNHILPVLHSTGCSHLVTQHFSYVHFSQAGSTAKSLEGLLESS